MYVTVVSNNYDNFRSGTRNLRLLSNYDHGHGEISVPTKGGIVFLLIVDKLVNTSSF
jgi:hypothetical protein